jgi:hypothetical protein
MPRSTFIPRSHRADNTTPFDSVEGAWFWFMAAHEAKLSGARFTAGKATIERPCEPVDILKAVDRLRRNRRLSRDHLHVMAHYGRRKCAPDPTLAREQKGYILWAEAMNRLSDPLVRKGIVTRHCHLPPITRVCQSAPTGQRQMVGTHA